MGWFGDAAAFVATGGASAIIKPAKPESIDYSAEDMEANAARLEAVERCITEVIGPAYFEATGQLIDQQPEVMQQYKDRLGPSLTRIALSRNCQQLADELSATGSAGESAIRLAVGAARGFGQAYAEAMARKYSDAAGSETVSRALGPSESSKRKMAEAARGMAKSYGDAMRRNAALLMTAGYTQEQRAKLLGSRGTQLREALERAQQIIAERERVKKQAKRMQKYILVGGVAAAVGLAAIGYKALR
jgi:hypothetical protein